MATTTTPLNKALTRQHQALEALASVVVAHGAPAQAPFAWFKVPSLPAILSLDAATSADWAIALVHDIFREPRLPNAVTVATKRVGNAARAVRRALEQERKARAAEMPASSRLAA